MTSDSETPRGGRRFRRPREIAGPVLDRGNMARKITLAAVVSVVGFFCLMIWGSCYQFWRAGHTPKAWRDDAFVLTGAFGADGSCTVQLDGRPVAGVAGANTAYDTSAILNAAPDGYDVHQIACNVPVDGAPNPKYGRRDFWVWGPVAAGRPLRPGRYRIADESIATGDTTAWEATLFAPEFDDQRAYLSGYQGHLRIDRTDSANVTGTFRIVARRVKRGPLE